MIDTFKEDICNLVKDYNRECISSTIDDVCQYVLEMLPNLGYNKKYLFDRFIRQLISELFPENNCLFDLLNTLAPFVINNCNYRVLFSNQSLK